MNGHAGNTQQHVQPKTRRARTRKRPTRKETPQPYPTGTVTGHPDTAYATNTTTPSNHTPTRGACSRAARNALITSQPQVNGNHHEHTPTRECAHPSDAESRPNMAETRKREKPTPRPPEQRRGKPQQTGAWTPADSRGLEPHPNKTSEPISSRTQQPCWITVQNGETKQPSSTRSAQQEPAHHPPNVGHQRPTGGTNH